ncbi:hypothetical protein GCM10009839_25860 [Catenulispora yoronensis]|uniref:Uncharacterized protein n=1 Tax=Catenulispora yoronensis TaxID=450799 RepID=A0ABN2TZV5_9ACTN
MTDKLAYRRSTGRGEALRQALHAPASGRIYDCQAIPGSGPARFTADQPGPKVGWARAQFPPCPLLARSVPELVEAMWALRKWASNPSYRMLERRAEHLERKAGTVRALPHATLHRVMTRTRMPRLELLELFVKACGAEAHWDEWHRAWFAINADLHRASMLRRGRRNLAGG